VCSRPLPPHRSGGHATPGFREPDAVGLVVVAPLPSFPAIQRSPHTPYFHTFDIFYLFIKIFFFFAIHPNIASASLILVLSFFSIAITIALTSSFNSRPDTHNDLSMECSHIVSTPVASANVNAAPSIEENMYPLCLQMLIASNSPFPNLLFSINNL